MALIDNPDAARRLARAIASDILLCHREEIAKGGDVSEAIAEGRALFASRVTPAHHWILEETVRELLSGKRTPSTGNSAPLPSRPSDTSVSRTPRVAFALAIVAAALILAGMLLKQCN
jgi:hypothetical protein